VSAGDAFAAAEANLRAKSPPSWKPIAPGVVQATWGDAFDAARVLIGDVLETAPVAGPKVAMMPDRDRLFVASADDATGLLRMASLALAAYDEHCYQLSPQAFAHRDGTWSAFALPDAVGYDVEKRRVGALQEAYATQKALLEKFAPSDTFVATFSPYASDEKRALFTIATWTIGVQTLLPKTDQLMFVRAEKDVVRVHWHDAVRVVGDRFEPVDGWPERYLVRSFPTNEEYAVLRGLAVR
jgi:hypothetical protein